MSDDTPRDSVRRLAIIGGGSSGLISLKYAIEMLSDWDVVCYERSGDVIGCWGNPYPGFVSTSTKYTTQFSCFREYDASVHPDGGESRSEFFRDSEYGDYLTRFAQHFGLMRFIRLHSDVTHLRRCDATDAPGSRWKIDITKQGCTTTETFDHVIVATGLAAIAKATETNPACLDTRLLNRPYGIESVRNQSIVVVGGGESAVDHAYRLSRPDLSNQVYLSLKSGIRVSPRYHPIRGVPSDFLRNRLMLSIHEDIRNFLGHHFVQWRIRYQEHFQWAFSSAGKQASIDDSETESRIARRKEWAMRLTLTAKDGLFDMFHNKSDDFLDAVAEGKICIIGPEIPTQPGRYQQFDSDECVDVQPDLVVPAIGYESCLGGLSGNTLAIADFYLGVQHVQYPNVHLVGFARPIIGNIPTISEVQAQLICGTIANRFERPKNIALLHTRDQPILQRRYRKINLAAVYPVEMFTYCDRLARIMGTLSSPRRIYSWLRSRLTPATTLHYGDTQNPPAFEPDNAPIYLPPILIGVLLLIKPLDVAYRFLTEGLSQLRCRLRP